MQSRSLKQHLIQMDYLNQLVEKLWFEFEFIFYLISFYNNIIINLALS